jgi:hypothetical protein
MTFLRKSFFTQITGITDFFMDSLFVAVDIVNMREGLPTYITLEASLWVLHLGCMLPDIHLKKE